MTTPSTQNIISSDIRGFFKVTKTQAISSSSHISSISLSKYTDSNCVIKECSDTYLDDISREMKYTDKHLAADGIKFIRKIRCKECGFRICTINNKNMCLWCFDSMPTSCWSSRIIRHDVRYGPYKGKTHGYVLWKDIEYCKNRLDYKDTKLCQLTKRILEEDTIYSFI
jgi:hypothetical protein